jgi:hypothetical protein
MAAARRNCGELMRRTVSSRRLVVAWLRDVVESPAPIVAYQRITPSVETGRFCRRSVSMW